MSTVVLYCWCHSDDASVHLYFTFHTDLVATKRQFLSGMLKWSGDYYYYLFLLIKAPSVILWSDIILIGQIFLDQQTV